MLSRTQREGGHKAIRARGKYCEGVLRASDGGVCPFQQAWHSLRSLLALQQILEVLKNGNATPGGR